MNTDCLDQAEGSAGWFPFLGWSVLFVGLLAWQAWLTLSLFGAEAPWPNLTSPEPLLSGSHPQHLYLSQVGARALRETGANCAYDPFFQAGYLKTPVFDGCRISELFLVLVPTEHPAVAYKLGLAAVCLAVPVLLFLTCWGAGVDLLTAAVACGLGVLIWWGPHGRSALEAGDFDIFLASLATLCHFGFLIRFDREAGFRAWAGLVLSGALGWLAQPLLFPFVLPLLLVYYLSAGVRHPLPWHLALFAAQATALAVNLTWLGDWASYWWLRAELPSPADMLPHRTFATFWNAPLWGTPGHRLLALTIFGSAVAGVLIWNETRRRTAARILGLGALTMMGLTLLGISWEPLGQIGTSIFLSPALWFASIPAAHAWTWGLAALCRTTLGRCGLTIVLVGLIFAGYVVRDELTRIAQSARPTEPLAFGLGPRRQQLVETLKQYTHDQARILWEDRKTPRRAACWSPLLPILTERQFLGGLDPNGVFELSSISFIDGQLERRNIADWTDQALAEYCKRYNVAWVVAWSPAVIQRFQSFSGVERAHPVHDDVPGMLFVLKPMGGAIVTRGQAQVIQMDGRHIALADVVPEEGEVVLNLHYVKGLKASPGRVQVQVEPCGYDPIGFIRLKMATPVPRVTLTWDRR